MKSDLKTIIETHNISWCLIDVAGVFYNQAGQILDHAKQAVAMLYEQNIKVGLMTNNSMQHPSVIKQWFETHDVYLDENAIMSSGLCLIYDEQLNSMIRDKAVYVEGRDSCYQYFTEAGVRQLVDSPETADVVALMSHSGEPDISYLNHLAGIINDRKANFFEDVTFSKNMF